MNDREGPGDAGESKLRKAVAMCDWARLRVQKQTLVAFTVRETWLPASALEDLQGIVAFLDAVQDASVDDGIATEEEVFGPPEEA
jgi:hypothetical protein